MSNIEIEYRIRPGSAWHRIDWRAIWLNRDILILFVRRDFIAKYAQTALGPLWFFVQPLITTVIFTIVFSRIANISTNDAPPLLFYLVGMLPWSYFANTFSATSQTLTANAGLFSKVYFPRLIVPIAAAISNTFAFMINFALAAVVYVGHLIWGDNSSVFPKWYVCFMPFTLGQVALLAIGVGLWMSALTTKYKDFSHVSAFIVGVWFYATPVIFPLAIVPANMLWLAKLNPLAFSEETFRLMLLGEGYVDLGFAITSTAISVMAFLTGVLAFQRYERCFVDTV